MEPKTRVAKIINRPDNAPTVRHGTVESVDGDTLQVLIDNTASPITCARACVCVQGDRVVVVGKDAIATVGANYGGGGSGSIATTGNVLKGDNAGNAIAATPGTDYMAPVTLAEVATSGDYNDLDNLPTIPAAGLPTGGSSGQVLAKSSGTDYDAGWVTPSGGGTSTWYATSSTTASTAAKVVDCTGYTLAEGAVIGILFSTANTASAPTLNINSTGAIALRIGNTAPSSNTNVLKWSANTMIYVMYDGTYYRLINAVSRATDNSPDGAGTWYGTSATAASIAAKTSTITNFRLTPGAIVSVLFSSGNSVTASAITLNVNSTGAKTIAVAQGPTSASIHLLWEAKSVLTFIYDGAYWRYLGTSQPPTAVLPVGGTTGQVLAKASDADYDVGWVTGGGGVSLQVVSGTADDQSVSASSYVGVLIDITVPAGYTPIGVVGVHLANATNGGTGVTLASIAQFYVSSSTQAYVRIKNPSSTALKLAVTADVLCVSN